MLAHLKSTLKPTFYSPRAFYCCKMCKKSKSTPFLYYKRKLRYLERNNLESKNFHISNCIFTMKGWTVKKKLFWDVFLRLAYSIPMKNFSFHSPALHVFCKKNTYFLSYLWGKYFSCKMFTVLHPSKKKLSALGQNWAKTKQLLLKIFQLLIAMEGCIVQW